MPRFNHRTRAKSPNSSNSQGVNGSQAGTSGVQNQYVGAKYIKHTPVTFIVTVAFVVTIAIAIISISGGYNTIISTPNWWVSIFKPSESKTSPDPTVIPTPTSAPQIPISPESADNNTPQAHPNNGSNIDNVVKVPPSDSATRIYKKHREAIVMIYVGEDRQGSGVIVSPNGVIVTNAHVVKGKKQVKVKSTSGKTYDGVVSFTNDKADIAVVDVQSSQPLPCIVPSNRSVAVGETVFALSNPWGLESTFTFGMVNKIDQNSDIIHQSVIAAGSSGAPLFDKDGNWIAINTELLDKVPLYRAIPTSVIEKLPLRPFCPNR